MALGTCKEDGIMKVEFDISNVELSIPSTSSVTGRKAPVETVSVKKMVVVTKKASAMRSLVSPPRACVRDIAYSMMVSLIMMVLLYEETTQSFAHRKAPPSHL